MDGCYKEVWCWTLDVALERWCRIHHASGDVRRDVLANQKHNVTSYIETPPVIISGSSSASSHVSWVVR
jgi:hypothetical protein